MSDRGFPDLRSFLARLRADGDLVEIEAPVSADLEAAEIHRRVIAADGPALLFRNVEGASFPLATNLFGTARRAEIAFGERPLRLMKRLVEVIETALPPTPATLWGARDLAAGKGTVALYLNALTADDVFQVTEAGETLPQKSTYFAPKLPTGLLFRRLEAGE